MRKITITRIVFVILTIFVLLPRSVMAMTDLLIDREPTCTTLEEYHTALEAVYVSDSFIYYEDIAFIGDFVFFHGDDFDIYNCPEYAVRDSSGATVTVRFKKYTTPIKDAASLNESYRILPMPQRESFYHSPEGFEADSAATVAYQFEDALYLYRVFQANTDETEGSILTVQWVYGDYLILVGSGTSFGAAPYPEDAQNTLMARLLDSSTAKAAMEQVNRAIFRRQLLVTIRNSVPLLLCVACALSVSGIGLILWRRKKAKNMQ